MNIDELKIAVDKSNAVFKKIKEKYPVLAGHLVLSSPDGQCNLTTDLLEILKTFPAMIVDSRQKENALILVPGIASIEKGKNIYTEEHFSETMRALKDDLSGNINMLELRDDTFVEIRFDEKKVNLSLIFELQKDELISRKHTPQTKASVRIVLGMIGDLMNIP